jgi:lipopolysaccharide transport system ATP-binding protein
MSHRHTEDLLSPVPGRRQLPADSPPLEDPPAISARGLSKRYYLQTLPPPSPRSRIGSSISNLLAGRAWSRGPRKELWALDGVSFDVERGGRVAIIGRNGAGKSTLLKILSRIVAPTRGEARIRGRLTSLLEVGIGFNNKLTGRENIFANASLHGLTRQDTAVRLDQIVEFSGIDPRFLDMRVKHYSSGMRVRLAFSVAAHLDPDILLLDEVLAVGDMAFQEKCLERVEGLMKERRTLLFVSHDMSAVTRFCPRAIWLEQGRVVLDGPSKDVVVAYMEEMRKAIATWKLAPSDGQDAGGVAPVTAEPPTVAEARADRTPSDHDAGALELAPDGTIQEPPAAHFLAVRAIDKDARDVKAITVDQRLGVEFTYEVTRDGKVILPSARFYNADGTLLFTAVYSEPGDAREPRASGHYCSVLWVPAHLFNVGTVHISVGLSTPGSGKLQRHQVIERALCVEVFEAPFGVRSARGPYRDVRGAVRPLCDWETRSGASSPGHPGSRETLTPAPVGLPPAD